MNSNGVVAPKEYRSFGRNPFKTLTQRCFIIAIVVFIFFMLCIVLATTLSRKSKDYCPDGIHCDWRSIPPAQFMKDERCDSVCTTKPCLRSAEFSLRRIDVSKDPCDDFYEFACGKFEEEAILFPDVNDAALTYHEMENELMLKLKEIIDSIPSKVQGKASEFLLLARKFYDDCMNTDYHPDVIDRNAIGIIIGKEGVVPWPLVNESLHNDADQLAEVMSSSIFYDVNPFFSLPLVEESEHSGEEKHKLIFQFRDFDAEQLSNIQTKPAVPVDDNHIYAQYVSTIHKILQESGVTETEIQSVSEKILEFEMKYKTAVLKAINSMGDKILNNNYQDGIPKYQKFDCQDLEKRMRSLKWCQIVENLLEAVGRPDDSRVELRFPETMPIYDAINDVISRANRNVVIDYLVVKFIMNHLKYMPSSLRHMFYRNPQLFHGSNKYRVLTSRWQQCVDVTADFFAIPLELEYLNEKISESEKNTITLVFNKMKEAYLSFVNKIQWADDTAKKKLAKEIQNLNMIVGNSFLWNDERGRKLVKNIIRSPMASTLKEDRITLIQDVLEMKKLIRRETPAAFSFGFWKQSGAFQIFPDADGPVFRLFYGMLQYPLFLDGRPMYAEFATLGKNILTLLFRKTILNLASENTTEIFETSLKCLFDQRATLDMRKLTLKGKMDEHKRSSGSLYNTLATLASTEAYLKYLKENNKEKGLPGLPFNSDQLFFISLAQVNCEAFREERYQNYPTEYFTPSRERVNMPLANSESFSKAFRCKSGSKMNPKLKCCILGDRKTSENCK